MSSTVQSRSQDLVEIMSLIDDPMERLGYFVSKAKRDPVLEGSVRIKAFQIEGCISELWLVPRIEEGRLYFRTDAAASIPKGVAAVLAEIYSGGTPAEILAVGDGFIREAGIPQVLSSNRSNGLAHLVGRILGYAKAAEGENSDATA